MTYAIDCKQHVAIAAGSTFFAFDLPLMAVFYALYLWWLKWQHGIAGFLQHSIAGFLQHGMEGFPMPAANTVPNAVKIARLKTTLIFVIKASPIIEISCGKTKVIGKE